MSDAKLAHDFVGHDVFGDVATPRRPSTALSELKRHEMIGQNIFADGQDEGYRKNTEGEMRFSDARAAAVAEGAKPVPEGPEGAPICGAAAAPPDTGGAGCSTEAGSAAVFA